MDLMFCESGLSFDGWRLKLKARDGGQVVIFQARRPLLHDIFGFGSDVSDIGTALIDRQPLLEVACVRAYERVHSSSNSLKRDTDGRRVYIDLSVEDFPVIRNGQQSLNNVEHRMTSRKPLKFSNQRTMNEILRVIEFHADDNGRQVICRIGADAMLARAGLRQAQVGTLLAMYDTLIYEIRGVVRRKFAASRLEGDGSIAVTAEDLQAH